MNNYEIVKVLESCNDLETNSQRLMDFVDMGKNILKVEADFNEGKRITLKGKDIALKCTKKYQTREWYMIYLESMKYLAQHFFDFDSYMLYLEHKREPEEQFYLPRRECFRELGLMQGFTDLLEDKLDILTISLAPGVGKAGAMYSKVLTPDGFVQMKDIKVGDKVIAGNGNKSTVLGVYPQGKKPIYEFTLGNGAKTRVSDEHLWYIAFIDCDKHGDEVGVTKVITTSEIIELRKEEKDVYIPIFNTKKWMMGDFLAIKNIEYIGEEECQCIYISDPCHLYITDDYIITHNTTLEEMFISYVMGLYPELCNLFSSYSGTITEMFHRSVYNIITNKEYAWNDIFPDVKVESKSDKEEYINLGKYKPFKTLTCRSINSSTTGVTRAEGYLMCDDLVSGIEEALNPERLETLYMKYVSDLKSRRKLGCKEIHIATRWSVHDPIGHLQAQYDTDRARFIAVDCFGKDGKSVFDFKFQKGFTTKYFHEMEQSMDDVTFRCMYRSDPIEREGLLYHKDDIRTYLGGLPREDSDEIKEPDAILAICDTKDTGTDYNCLLVVYQYGENFYLEDLVYDNGSPYVLDELNANCLVKNNVQMAQFESNKEGSRTGNEVQKLIKEKGGRCVITKKYTTTNKETKIIVNSDWVKQHILFKDPSEYEKKSMYGQFMRAVFSYVTLGKNKHDDSVDALAMLALFVQSLESSVAEVYNRKQLGI